MTTITLLDYGMCNLLNMARAFKYCGAEVIITEDAILAAKAEKLVVPGVGAFADSMREIQLRGLDETIYKFIDTERPFLGICVGMQMLFQSSMEFGSSKGLGIFAGSVESIPNKTLTGECQRIPHIGWNQLIYPERKEASWEGSLLQGLENKEPSVYFVHSFVANPKDESNRLADILYGGHRLCAAVQKNNIMATQFHPERSAGTGLGILKKFMSL